MMGVSGGGEIWWWAASFSQLSTGVVLYRQGCHRSGTAMPFKAFGIATLFVGSVAAASVGALQTSGIHSLDDMKEVGKSIRRWIQVPPGDTN